jgi:hypothetical protein
MRTVNQNSGLNQNERLNLELGRATGDVDELGFINFYLVNASTRTERKSAQFTLVMASRTLDRTVAGVVRFVARGKDIFI